MGRKTKENLRTIEYLQFPLHSTASLLHVHETVIFQLKLAVNFCWLISTYLEKDVACTCQLTIYLTKQVKMVLLSPCLEQLFCFISFTDMQHTFCWTFYFFLIDGCLCFLKLCFWGLFPSAVAYKIVVFLSFSVLLLLMQ